MVGACGLSNRGVMVHNIVSLVHILVFKSRLGMCSVQQKEKNVFKKKKWFNEQTMALSANRRQNTHTAAFECCCCKLEKRVEVFLLLNAKYFCKKYILASYI